MATLLASCSFCPLGGAGEDLPQRPELLSRMSRVAQLYRDQALRFTCDETIVYYPVGGSRKVNKFAYVYSATAEGVLQDYRAPRRGGDRPGESLEPVGVPEYVTRAYSWIFIFEARLQSGYAFEIRRREEVRGRPAIRVWFEPIPPVIHDANDWHGTVWIDDESGQVLRAEGLKHEDFVARERFLADLNEPLSTGVVDARPGLYSFSEVRTDFAKEQHGMRFPSKVVVTGHRYRIKVGAYKKKARKLPAHKVVQTYKHYRFFGVRTREQIQRLVDLDETGAPE